MPPPAALRVVHRDGELPQLLPAGERHRLIIELRDGKPADEQSIRTFLRRLGDLCGLRCLGEPMATRLADGGCAGWLHAAEGGAQLLYSDEPATMLSVDLVARHELAAEQVVRFSALYFEAREAVGADPRRPGEHWRLTAEAAELRQLCEWAIAEARSGRDLARATTLVVGAGLEADLAHDLLARIAEGIAELHAANDPKLALTHGEGIGEALMLLRQAGVDASDLGAARPYRRDSATEASPAPAGADA
ncbi:MAG TPA: hypothetical protein VMD59_07445 [Acidimicrobiales bacterium]|nr:hypothetical protein [Acidimicrobiales bacterium]